VGPPRCQHRLPALGPASTTAGAHGHTEYILTSKGLELWPVLCTLLTWGDEHYSADGPPRTFRHSADDAAVTSDGTCAACGSAVPVQDLVVVPGPGLAASPATDLVTTALAAPHRLLQPVRS
jgi:hypothetical protein